MSTIFTASLKDDISFVASKMALSLSALDKKASDLFVDSHGNFKDFQKALKAGNVSTVDAALITAKYKKELIASRKEALGLGNAAEQAAKAEAKAIKAVAKEREKAAKEAKKAAKEEEKQNRERERAAKNSTWGKMKSAFSEAVSPKQMAIGFARGVGDRAVGAPAAILGTGLNIVGGIASAAADAGKSLVSSVIEAAEFRQNALTGLEYMLGSRKEAEEIFADAQKMAGETPLDTDKVIEGMQALITQGFNKDESKQLYKLVADQQSKFLSDSTMQDKVISAFSRLKGRGVATGEDLESLRVAGFRAEGIIEELLGNQDLAPLFKKVKVAGIAGSKSKMVDLKDATNEDKLKMVKETLGEGKIGKYTLLNAVIASAEKGKADIGEFAKKMGKESLTGSISNFKSAFGDLLKSTNIDQWPGMKALQAFLNKISDAMKGEGGKQLLSTIQSIMDSLLGGLGKISDADISGFIKMIGTLGEQAVGVIKQAWEWLDKLLHSGSIGGGIKAALLDVAKLIGAGIWYGVKNSGELLKSNAAERKASFQANTGGLSESFMEAKAAAAGVPLETFAENFGKAKSAFYAKGGSVDFSGGGSAQDAIWNAISPTLTAQMASQLRESMLTIGNAGAEGLQAGVKEPLQIHSPSRTMAYLGEMAAKGLVEGTEKGVETAEPVSGGRGCSVTIGSINVGSGYGDAEAAGMAIARVVEREVMAVFERAADE
jgi:hypothetical protein